MTITFEELCEIVDRSAINHAMRTKTAVYICNCTVQYTDCIMMARYCGSPDWSIELTCDCLDGVYNSIDEIATALDIDYKNYLRSIL